MHKPKYLLDVNCLIALFHQDHVHHKLMIDWFDSSLVAKKGWGVCPFTEAGFVRILSGPAYPALTVADVLTMLERIQQVRGYVSWPISDHSDFFLSVIGPFRNRVVGYKQIIDAYLLGLAIKENALLVTLDRPVLDLAGPTLKQYVCLLQNQTSR